MFSNPIASVGIKKDRYTETYVPTSRPESSKESSVADVTTLQGAITPSGRHHFRKTTARHRGDSNEGSDSLMELLEDDYEQSHSNLLARPQYKI